MLIPPLYDSYCAGHRKMQPENGAAKAARWLQMHVVPDEQPKVVRIKKRNSPSSKLLLFEKIEWNANNDHEWICKNDHRWVIYSPSGPSLLSRRTRWWRAASPLKRAA